MCSYDEFYEQQAAVITTYPDSVQNEVRSYNKAVTSYFAVKRSDRNVRDTNLLTCSFSVFACRMSQYKDR